MLPNSWAVEADEVDGDLSLAQPRVMAMGLFELLKVDYVPCHSNEF